MLVYIGQSGKNKQSENYSVLVAKLVYFLSEKLHKDISELNIEKKHKILGTDLDYFKKDGLISYDLNSFLVKEEFAKKEKKVWNIFEANDYLVKEHLKLVENKEDKEEVEISLRKVIAFFKDAPAYYLKEKLGINFDRKDNSEVENDEYIFEIDQLRKYEIIKNKLGKDGILNNKVESFNRKILEKWDNFSIKGMGDCEYERLMKDYNELQEKIDKVLNHLNVVNEEDIEKERYFKLRFLNKQLICFPSVIRVLNEGSKALIYYRYLKFKGKDILEAYLQQIVLTCYYQEPFDLYIIFKDSIKKVASLTIIEAQEELKKWLRYFEAGENVICPFYERIFSDQYLKDKDKETLEKRFAESIKENDFNEGIYFQRSFQHMSGAEFSEKYKEIFEDLLSTLKKKYNDFE